MGTGFSLVFGLLGACAQEAVDTEPCPDLGDGGFEVVEGEVEEGDATYCVAEEAFDGADADISKPANWIGSLWMMASGFAAPIGTTRACPADAFPNVSLITSTGTLSVEVTAGMVTVERASANRPCGTFRLDSVTLVSPYLRSALYASAISGDLQCESNCSLD